MIGHWQLQPPQATWAARFSNGELFPIPLHICVIYDWGEHIAIIQPLHRNDVVITLSAQPTTTVSTSCRLHEGTLGLPAAPTTPLLCIYSLLPIPASIPYYGLSGSPVPACFIAPIPYSGILDTIFPVTLAHTPPDQMATESGALANLKTIYDGTKLWWNDF